MRPDGIGFDSGFAYMGRMKFREHAGMPDACATQT
jgi:hypothetical protein